MKKYLSYISPEQFITVPYQVISFITSATFILFLSIRILIFEFNPIEIKPEIQTITPQVVKQWGADPIKIKTGLSIVNFLVFDTIGNNFKLNLLVWFEYDPLKVDAALLDKFVFVGTTRIDRSPPSFEDLPGGLKVVKYDIWLVFKAELLYRRFPFDDHMIYLNLTNYEVKPSEFIYDADPADFKLFSEIKTGGWNVASHTTQVGFYQKEISQGLSIKNPRTLFSLGVSKEDVRQVFLILLPLLFLFYLSLFSFAIVDIRSALISSQSAVIGILAYSFVMQSLSPAVGYFMISDFIFLLLLAASVITYLINMGSASMLEDKLVTLQTIQKIKGSAVIILYSLLLIIFYYLIMYSNMVTKLS